MRKAGIALTVIGAVAFAALLGWGLTFGTARADTPTPTPTATATATAAQTCSPGIPGTYNGAVTLGGVPAPDGTTIVAKRGGIEWGRTTTAGGRYVLDVPKGLQVNPPCFADTTGPVTFECDGTTAAETPNWGSGLQDQNLTCAALASPTVAPPTATATTTATVTVAPTGTVVAPPPTGIGSGGADGGFLWWPLALAAAALTAVAGLYTARRATR